MKKNNNVSLVYSLENTFVKKDIDYLNTITKKLYLHSSRPHKDPLRFLWNRVSELFFSLFYVSRSAHCLHSFLSVPTGIPKKGAASEGEDVEWCLEVVDGG